MESEQGKLNLYNEVKELSSEGNNMLSQGLTEAAVHLFRKAHEKAKEMNHDLLLRACCFNVGAGYLACGDASSGLSFLKLALATGEEEFDTETSADLHFNLGIGYQMKSSFDDCVHNFSKAAECYSELEDKQMETSALEKLALCYKSAGMLSQACEVYEKVQSIYAELGNLNQQAITLSCIATLCVQMKNIDACAKALNLLLDLSQDIEDRNLRAKLLHEVGLIYNAESCYQSASECFEHALISLDMVDAKTVDRELKGVILQNLGAIYNKMYNFDKAQSYHQKAIDTFGELGDRKSQSQVFLNLAHAHCHSKNYEDAVSCFMHAIQASKDCGDKEGQWLATEGLAATYFRRGNYERAVKEYKTALALLASFGQSDTEHADRVVKKLANAVEHQVKQRKIGTDNQAVSRRKEEGVSGHRVKYGKLRSDRHHSYITKGLATYSEDGTRRARESEDSDEELEKSQPESEENNRSEEASHRGRTQKVSIVSEVREYEEGDETTDSGLFTDPTGGESGGLTHSSSKLQNKGLVQQREPMLKVDREIALARIHHDNVRRGREEQLREAVARKDKSRVCLLQ